MSKLIAILTIVFTTAGIGLQAHAGLTVRKVELENQIQSRIFSIVERADPYAIVQVEVTLKKVQSNLPMFGLDASVTPVEFDGQLGSSSIESIKVRVVSQVDAIPDWIRSEVQKSASMNGVKVAINYEKAGGQVTDRNLEFTKIAKDFQDLAISTINQVKLGVWGMLAALVVCLFAIALAITSIARRLERSMSKVIEEQIVPAMQQNQGGKPVRAEKSEDSGGSSAQAQAQAHHAGNESGQNELKDFPVEALLTVLSDCYWTESDGYAHFLWKQMSQAQKDAVLQSGLIDRAYFSFIRHVPPVNLDYHSDARYLLWGKEFRTVSQTDLNAWLSKNSKLFFRITPMRWDLLPLSLEQRLTFSEMKMPTETSNLAPLELTTKSAARVLPNRLQLRGLKVEDEVYLWENSAKVSSENRSSLKTLVWLALTPTEYRQKVLADLDARQLAEAWSGPAPVLEKLKEAMAQKKIETLEHFLDSTPADRSSDTFAYLVESGLNYKNETEPEAQKMAS